MMHAAMRRNGYLLGLDAGTQSVTACVFTTDGRLAGRGTAPLRVLTPRPGRAEQDPSSWWPAARAAIRASVRGIDPRRLIALGLAFQRETFTLADRRGRYLRPAILWLDVRASHQVRALARSIGAARFRRRTGKALDVTCALPRLLWLRGHEPGVLRRAAHWVDTGSALAHALTGRRATCVSGADTCGLIGLASRDWLAGYARAGGVGPGMLPELVEPGGPFGTVTSAAARETGLPSGLPVIAAGGDGQVFAVGAGAARPWSLSLGLGTSIVLGMTSPRPRVSPLHRTLLMAPGSYLLESVLQSGTYLLRWFLSGIDGGRHDEEHWNRLAAAVPAGSEGLVTLPHWWGVRFPESRPDARGVVAGWGNQHTAAHLYRSLLEGSAFELRRLLAEYESAFPGLAGKLVHAGGGGSRSRLWIRILADALERPVRPASHTDGTALGAAILAGTGTGRFPSVAEGSRAMCGPGRSVNPVRRRSRTYGRIFRKSYLPLLEASLRR